MADSGETPLERGRRLIGEMREQQERLRKALEPLCDVETHELVSEEQTERRLVGGQLERRVRAS